MPLAQEALDALKKTVYDCMVIDLKLSDMSGEQLLKKMTEQENLASFPPVIVYTGRSLSRDEEYNFGSIPAQSSLKEPSLQSDFFMRSAFFFIASSLSFRPKGSRC